MTNQGYIFSKIYPLGGKGRKDKRKKLKEKVKKGKRKGEKKRGKTREKCQNRALECIFFPQKSRIAINFPHFKENLGKKSALKVHLGGSKMKKFPAGGKTPCTPPLRSLFTLYLCI